MIMMTGTSNGQDCNLIKHAYIAFPIGSKQLGVLLSRHRTEAFKSNSSECCHQGDQARFTLDQWKKSVQSLQIATHYPTIYSRVNSKASSKKCLRFEYCFPSPETMRKTIQFRKGTGSTVHQDLAWEYLLLSYEDDGKGASPRSETIDLHKDKRGRAPRNRRKIVLIRIACSVFALLFGSVQFGCTIPDLANTFHVLMRMLPKGKVTLIFNRSILIPCHLVGIESF